MNIWIPKIKTEYSIEISKGKTNGIINEPKKNRKYNRIITAFPKVTKKNYTNLDKMRNLVNYNHKSIKKNQTK